VRGMTYEDWVYLDPRDWPHTPPLDVYLRIEKENRNLFWYVDSGHIQNLLDEAIDRLEECTCSGGLSSSSETP